MKLHTVAKLVLFITIALAISSCATFFNGGTSYGVTGIYAEKRTNGYVFKIEGADRIGRVEAWLGDGNWLYMSIPDTTIDSTQLGNLSECPIVSDVKVFRYTGSVQITLHLKEQFFHVSVLTYPDDDNAYVVLYQNNDIP